MPVEQITLLVSGTAPVWADGSCDPDPGVQATRCVAIIAAALEEAGFEVVESDATMKPKNTVPLSDPADVKAVLRLLDLLDDHEDVQAVHSNVDIPDDVLEAVS